MQNAFPHEKIDSIKNKIVRDFKFAANDQAGLRLSYLKVNFMVRNIFISL